MKPFIFPENAEIQCFSRRSNPCYDYAALEISRLLNKAGIRTRMLFKPSKGGAFALFVGRQGAEAPAPPRFRRGAFPDDYILCVSAGGVLISSPTAKGILNGVYDLAEKAGCAFLLPGEDGEWIPDKPRSLAPGRTDRHSRFRHRGIFFGGLTHDYSVREWLEFYAKLRFNSIGLHGLELDDRDLPLRLGLRMETGGHGYRDLLPRKLFSRRPELFRMEQPQDFGGERVPDYNSCVGSSEARAIMRENFRPEARRAAEEGYYALHRWPDDLPGGGWCLCPDCRGFAPSDQAMLAMRNLAVVVREEQLPLRVPMLAYHDTMEPAGNIPPSEETYLLFAPRERCYKHRLDDPGCARNRYYLNTLVQWNEKYKGIGDAHTFEYYCDQILFRGMHPYLPDVIAGDMQAYERLGIESHMALHIAGTAVAPDWNMLFFARGFWEAGLSPRSFNESFPLSFCEGPAAAAWTSFLEARAKSFAAALGMCDHDLKIYLDYRWLPGTTKPFGRKMARACGKSSKTLAQAATRLEFLTSATGPERLRHLAAAEVARSRFEAAELEVMSSQQESVNQAARFLISRNPKDLDAAITSSEAAVQGFQPALALARKAGISEKCWYFEYINRWLTKEMKQKVRAWKRERRALKSPH